MKSWRYDEVKFWNKFYPKSTFTVGLQGYLATLFTVKLSIKIFPIGNVCSSKSEFSYSSSLSNRKEKLTHAQ